MARFTYYSATSPTSLQKLLVSHILPLLSVSAERVLASLPCILKGREVIGHIVHSGHLASHMCSEECCSKAN